MVYVVNPAIQLHFTWRGDINSDKANGKGSQSKADVVKMLVDETEKASVWLLSSGQLMSFERKKTKEPKKGDGLEENGEFGIQFVWADHGRSKLANYHFDWLRPEDL